MPLSRRRSRLIRCWFTAKRLSYFHLFLLFWRKTINKLFCKLHVFIHLMNFYDFDSMKWLVLFGLNLSETPNTLLKWWYLLRCFRLRSCFVQRRFCFGRWITMDRHSHIGNICWVLNSRSLFWIDSLKAVITRVMISPHRSWPFRLGVGTLSWDINVEAYMVFLTGGSQSIKRTHTWVQNAWVLNNSSCFGCFWSILEFCDTQRRSFLILFIKITFVAPC